MSAPTVDQPDALAFSSLADLCASVDARGPRRWLVSTIWPSGDYGVLGAEPKLGKTWLAVDLIVSVASGLPFLGAFAVEDPGPVVAFLGEGGDGNIVRRNRAVAGSKGVRAEDLPISICTRAPHLGNAAHLAELEAKIKEVGPKLVVIDPLYLAARGANGADLYAMGALLEGPQRICQAVGAALLVVTHYNRSRDLTGAARITGAGPAEWGRVLLAAAIVTKHTDPDTRASTVLVEIDITGGEVPDQKIRVRRVITADDPDDIDSPLRYAVDLPDRNDPIRAASSDRLEPAAEKLLAAVRAHTEPATARQLVDWIANTYGHGLSRQTVSEHLNTLAAAGLIGTIDPGNGKAKLWLTDLSTCKATGHPTPNPTGTRQPVGSPIKGDRSTRQVQPTGQPVASGSATP